MGLNYLVADDKYSHLYDLSPYKDKIMDDIFKKKLTEIIFCARY